MHLTPPVPPSRPAGLTTTDLHHQLTALGIQPADILLVHSSLRSIGYVRGGANTVIDALLAAVGPTGTVLFPTLTGSSQLGPDRPPRFNPARDPCWTGKIPDTAWRRPDAIRSLHPTHSVAAIGPAAAELIRNHEYAGWPCGPGTPYYRHAQRGGKILLIGCDLQVVTTLHGLEEQLNLPYHLQPRPVVATIITPTGPITLTTRIHLYGPKRAFWRLEPLLHQANALTIGKLGQATCRLINAARMLEIGRDALRRDREFFLADDQRGRGWADGTHPRLTTQPD